MRTVREVSHLVGLSVRTLHYYDAIGLLKPTHVAQNGYRYYDDKALARLQEILLFRELAFPLKEIIKILDNPYYNSNKALTEQIKQLELQKAHLEQVIAHAKALQKGGEKMTFTCYNKTQLKALEEEAEKHWGKTKAYLTYTSRANQKDSEQFSKEMKSIFQKFGQLSARSVTDQAVQNQVTILQNYISQEFYDCTREELAGLGAIYIADERFKEYIDQIGGPKTAEFVSRAIEHFCNQD